MTERLAIHVSGDAIAITRLSTGTTAVGTIDPTSSEFVATNPHEMWSGILANGGIDATYSFGLDQYARLRRTRLGATGTTGATFRRDGNNTDRARGHVHLRRPSRRGVTAGRPQHAGAGAGERAVPRSALRGHRLVGKVARQLPGTTPVRTPRPVARMGPEPVRQQLRLWPRAQRGLAADAVPTAEHCDVRPCAGGGRRGGGDTDPARGRHPGRAPGELVAHATAPRAQLLQPGDVAGDWWVCADVSAQAGTTNVAYAHAAPPCVQAASLDKLPARTGATIGSASGAATERSGSGGTPAGGGGGGNGLPIAIVVVIVVAGLAAGLVVTARRRGAAATDEA